MQSGITGDTNISSSPTQSLVLASSSRYRKMLIERLGLNVECIAPEIDETPLVNENGEALAMRLARQKSEVIASTQSNRFVIGSDQVAVVTTNSNTEITLGKSGTRQKAFEQLSLCQNKTVTFYTSVCLYNPKTTNITSHTDITDVTFRALCERQIYQYIDIEKPFDCAGSFKCEGLGIRLFTSIDNQDPTALIGLPLIGLSQLLLDAGIDPLN